MPQINISVDINESIYIRDPLTTKLGKRIVFHAILLFDEIGFERFNFKRLAKSMQSTEASVYRYFENKYKLLAYLVAWYWDFAHFMILMDTRNVVDPKERLGVMIRSMVNAQDHPTAPDYIDLAALHRTVVENTSKVFHNQRLRDLRKDGFHMNLPKLVKRISDTVKEINPEFKYPNTLASNIIELSLNNEYYIEYLPEFSDKEVMGDKSPREATIDLVAYFLERLL